MSSDKKNVRSASAGYHARLRTLVHEELAQKRQGFDKPIHVGNLSKRRAERNESVKLRAAIRGDMREFHMDRAKNKRKAK